MGWEAGKKEKGKRRSIEQRMKPGMGGRGDGGGNGNVVQEWRENRKTYGMEAQ